MSDSTQGMIGWDRFDPWGIFKQMRDTYLESTAQALVNLVNTEQYAQAMGDTLSTHLEITGPLHTWMDKVMPHVLAHYGLPSRKELLSVASRMNSIEMRLDDIEATLDEIRQALRENQEPERKAA